MADKKSKSIDLGLLQTEFQTTQKDAIAAEKALIRAQEVRDATKAKFEAADVALRGATRTVLG